MADFYDIKNASVEDFEEIMHFYFSPNIKFFGEPQGKQLSPQTYFSRYVSHRLLIRKLDATNAIVGYVELNNSPYIPALLEDCWMDWLTFHYCTRLPLSVTNTYFFNTFVYNDSHNPQMLKQIVEEFFFRENKIRFIITAEPPECPNANSVCAHGHGRQDFQCLEAVSHIFYPICFSAITCPNTECIHVIYRDEMISTMRYRLALPEDNDDIVEIVHADRPELKDSLGDFYIAEELLATNTKSLLIITEEKIHNVTSGFVWLNEDLDFYSLLQNFQLDMFGNLMKFNPKLRFREKGIRINVATTTPAHLLFTSEAIQSLYDAELSLSLSSEDNESSIQFLAKCQLLDEKFEDPDHYVKPQVVNHAFRYNIPDDVEQFPYDGYPNAFSIQLFGLSEKHDPRRMYSFLSTAFVAFPDRDYCLLSVSVTISMTPVLFEVLKYFLRTNPRPGCKIDEHLYITHRSAIYGDLSIVRLRPKDKQDILNLFVEPTETVGLVTRRTTVRTKFIASRVSMISNVQDMSKMSTSEDVRKQAAFDRKTVQIYLDHILENPSSSYQCFSIRCGNSTKPPDENSLIGFVLIKPFLYNISLQKHYILPKTDENVNLFNAELIALKLHPFFHYQADVIFRELARQTHYRQFYYFKPSRTTALCNDLITNMQPMEPRRIKKVWFCNFTPPLANKHKFVSMSSVDDEDLDTPTIDYLNDTFSLFSNNLRPSMFFGNATNIVVVGFGDMCKALLRLLLFGLTPAGKHMCTNNYLPSLNITVIANAGVVEAEYDYKFKCEFCENQDNCYINFNNADAFVRDVSDRLDTRLWVRFFGGTVSDINLMKRTIVLEKGCDIYYETLLLMCETDFEMPEILASYDTRKPANYLQINSRFDKITAYHKLRAFQAIPSDLKRKIVVYGAHIRTFEFINFLVTHGVAGKEVVLISPYSKEGAQRRLVLNNCTVDINIEYVLKEMVEDLGVEVNDHMNIEEFELHSDNRTLKSVKFKGLHSDKTVEIECDLFVCFEDKYLSKETIEMLEMTGLAMDSGRVLVNDQFQTSNPFVYALGKFIKHREPPNHQYLFVNPKEAVTKLMVYLGWNSEPKVVEEKFSMPAYFRAQLPMGYYIVKLVSPKRYLARHLNNEYGFRMTTYENREFARVRLNSLGFVEEIVVVTDKFQDFDFLKYFCGRHELLLNNLKSRWYLEEIKNFVDFFQEPWIELIMNDHFKKLQEYNKQIIKPAVDEVMNLNISREQRFKVMQNYANDFGITARLEEAVLVFLQDHREEFHTEFALPQDFPNINENTEPN